MKKIVKVLIGIAILTIGIIVGIIGMVAYAVSIDYDPDDRFGVFWEDVS